MSGPDRRIVSEGLPEFRGLVGEQLSAMGWPMFEDEEGATYLKLDGFFDAIITATIAVISGKIANGDGDPDADPGHTS